MRFIIMSRGRGDWTIVGRWQRAHMQYIFGGVNAFLMNLLGVNKAPLGPPSIQKRPVGIPAARLIAQQPIRTMPSPPRSCETTLPTRAPTNKGRRGAKTPSRPSSRAVGSSYHLWIEGRGCTLVHERPAAVLAELGKQNANPRGGEPTARATR